MNPVGVADIGSGSTKVLLGELKEGTIILAGVGKSKTEGVREGKICHPEKAGKSLKEALDRAGEMASSRVGEIYLGASGDVLNFSREEATVSITSRDGIVKKEDIRRLKEMIASDGSGVGETTIAVVPRDFTLDGQKGSADPVGLEARRLDLEATLVKIDKRAMNNYRRTVARVDLELKGILPAPICLGGLLLTEEGYRRGRILVDLGMDTTDVTVFRNGALQFHNTRGLGGTHLTGDIAAKLNVSREEARRIKHKTDLSDYKKVMNSASPGAGEEKKKEGEIIKALAARLKETFELILADISDQGFGDLTKYGIKITGGSCKLSGLTDFLDENFEEKFQIGQPERSISGIEDVIDNPVFTTALGLLACVTKGRFRYRETVSSAGPDDKSCLKETLKKLRSIFGFLE